MILMFTEKILENVMSSIYISIIITVVLLNFKILI